MLFGEKDLYKPMAESEDKEWQKNRLLN
jgi:hypothetical protein